MSRTLEETIVTVGSGAAIAWLLTHFVLPYWGFIASVGNTTSATLMFTAVALIRVYLIRQYYERKRKRNE